MRTTGWLVAPVALLVSLACASAPPAPGAAPETSPAATTPPAAAAPSPPAPLVNSAPTQLSPAQLARDAELVPSATAYLGAYGNAAASLAMSGATLFLSNRDGINQFYVGDAAHPKDPARRLQTPNGQRAQGATFTGDERDVLFLSDVSSDENFHIFRVGLDGTGLKDLTPAETLHRNPPVIARDKPGLFAYSAHAPASEKTSVYLQNIDGTPPREIFSDARGGELADVTPDGSHLLFQRSNADQDSIIFEIDAASGKSTRVFPPEGQTVNVSAGYSSSADRILLNYQFEGHHAELIAIDRKSGKTVARYEETIFPNGSINGFVVPPKGDWVALNVDGGNHSAVRILDASTLQIRRTVETPLGIAAAVNPTKDGKRFTLSQVTPDAPGDIFVVDAATGAVKPLRDDARPGLSAIQPLRVSIETIHSFDGLPIAINLYLPPGVSSNSPAAKKLPTLVSIHGGPSSSSKIRWSSTFRFYASLGYAIVEPNIRGSTGFGVAFQNADDKAKRGDALKDVEAVNKWARAQAWCDADRLTIMGGSYGGYMTLLAVARLPQLFRAGLDISGMSDLRTMEKLEDQSIRVYDETEFGILGKEDDLLFEWSPIKYVDQIVAPVFVYQGVHDPVTPQNEADQIVKALRQRKIPVEYMLIENEGHGISRRENNAEYLARTVRFLEENAGPLEKPK